MLSPGHLALLDALFVGFAPGAGTHQFAGLLADLVIFNGRLSAADTAAGKLDVAGERRIAAVREGRKSSAFFGQTGLD